MRKTLRLFGMLIAVLLFALQTQAQTPTNLGTEVVNGSYQQYALTDLCSFSQVRLQAISFNPPALPAIPSGTGPNPAYARKWEFYTNGYAELSYFDGGSGSGQTLGYSEATIGYNTSSGFGAEVGVDALITQDDDESAIYGALTFQSSFGKLSFGVPRPAIDAFLGSVPTIAGAVPFKIGQIGTTKRSIVTSSYLFTDDEVPVGLRYDGTFGTTNVGASYHRFDDADVYDLAANYRIGQTTLTGALEHLDAGGDADTRYFLGAETKFGQVSAGVLWSGNYAFSNDAALEAYAKFKPLDQLELSATDRKSTRLNSSHRNTSRMPSSA